MGLAATGRWSLKPVTQNFDSGRLETWWNNSLLQCCIEDVYRNICQLVSILPDYWSLNVVGTCYFLYNHSPHPLYMHSLREAGKELFVANLKKKMIKEAWVIAEEQNCNLLLPESTATSTWHHRRNVSFSCRWQRKEEILFCLGRQWK